LKEAYKIIGIGSDEVFIGNGIIAEFGNLDISLWIDEKSYNVVKYSIDATEQYRRFLYNNISEVEIIASLEKWINEVTVFNINQAPDFEIPADALNAELK
jgi:hypothetical protein